jgi:ABC-2 type transport system ATP-binding protein
MTTVDPATGWEVRRASRTDSVLAVDGLQVKRGGRQVLRNLSFAIARSSVTGLLGPSGCGKTTLMRVIVGVQAVSSGSARVLDLPAGSPALRGRIGYSTQNPAIYPDITVRENLRYFAAVLSAPPDAVDRVVDEVDMSGYVDHVVGSLSGGEQSRVNLAVALLGSPAVLVLDEPTVGVDPVLRSDLWSLFHRLAAGGSTLLISSHVMDEAERCDRLLLMREGRLIADDTPAELKRRTGTSDLEEAFLRLVEQKPGRS